MAKRTASTNDLQPGKYINPLTDFGFKRIFGTEANKDLLIDFLNAVLQIDGGIKELHYDNPERQGRAKADRRAVFDLYCTTGKGEHIIVEMQNARQDYFKDRVLYYATFPLQEQGQKKKKWNFKLAPVHSVNIVNFRVDNNAGGDRQYASYVQLTDRETKKVFYDKLSFVFLILPSFTKSIDELQTDFDCWMYVLKHLAKLNDLPEALRNRVFRKLFHVAEIAQMTVVEKKIYDQSLKRYRDMYLMEDELKEKDRELKKRDAFIKRQSANLKKQSTALKRQSTALEKKDANLRNAARFMLESGISVEQVAESTGLSIAEVERLGKSGK